MTVTVPTLHPTLLSALIWLVPVVLLFFYLRSELTPKRLLSIWESDGVLSTRLLAATALLIWAMCMYSTDRMKGADLESVLQWVAAFFAVGGVAKAAGALKGDTTVNAKTVQADVKTNTVNMDTNGQGPSTE